jgi:hypothetical protein
MSESTENLKVINPNKFDDIEMDSGPSILPVYSGNTTSIRNMLYDEEVWFEEASSQDKKEEIDHDELYKKILDKNLKNIYPPEPPINEMLSDEFKDKIGNGTFEYISDLNDRNMLINAWQAITLTNNWNFVAQDIDSFTWSNNSHISDISRKMEDLGYYGHSGASFGFIMRNMQYLAQNGENKFIELFENPYDDDDVFMNVDPELEPYPHEDAIEYEQRLKELVNRYTEKEKQD